MREKEIEQALVRKVKAKEGWCLKFASPSMTGIPDRLILLPKGKIGFVEVKRPGEKPRALQEKRIQQLRDLGYKVFVLDGKEQIENLIKKIGAD